MPDSRLLTLLLSCAALSNAAQIKFLPDTVCAGKTTTCTTTTTKVVALGSQRIAIRPYYLLSPLSSRVQSTHRRQTNRSSWRTETTYLTTGYYAQESTPKGFKFGLLSASSLRIDSLGPNDTLTLWDFQFGECFTCAIAASRVAATPATLGSGERVGILFGTDSTHLDTLWAIVNKWYPACALPRAQAAGQASPRTSHDASGRQWTTGTAATIEFTSAGPKLSEKP